MYFHPFPHCRTAELKAQLTAEPHWGTGCTCYWPTPDHASSLTPRTTKPSLPQNKGGLHSAELRRSSPHPSCTPRYAGESMQDRQCSFISMWKTRRHVGRYGSHASAFRGSTNLVSYIRAYLRQPSPGLHRFVQQFGQGRLRSRTSRSGRDSTILCTQRQKGNFSPHGI